MVSTRKSTLLLRLKLAEYDEPISQIDALMPEVLGLEESAHDRLHYHR